MFSKYLVELLGTFIFLTVILRQNNPLAIATTLLAMIYFGGAISGGHFNPVVSLIMYLNRAIKLSDLLVYILVQVLGGVMALLFNNVLKY